MVRIVPSDLPRVSEPKSGSTQKVNPKPADESASDLLQKDPLKASRIAEVIQMFRKKKPEPKSRNLALKRYLESQDAFEVGDGTGFRIDKKV